MNFNDSLEIVIIAAVADNGVIGDNGELPWYYPEDLKPFRRITVGHSVNMGRKAFDSIEERLGGELPKRRNIVLTRQGVSLDQSRVIEARSVDQAVEQAGNKREQRAYVIGGQSIYEQFLNRGIVDRLLITHIPEEYNGDTYWPGPDFSELDCMDCQNISEELVVSAYGIGT